MRKEHHRREGEREADEGTHSGSRRKRETRVRQMR